MEYHEHIGKKKEEIDGLDVVILEGSVERGGSRWSTGIRVAGRKGRGSKEKMEKEN